MAQIFLGFTFCQLKNGFVFDRETTKRFVNELKSQLAADITKRMCETFAFYLYDQWWQDQEVKYKEKVRFVHAALKF